MNAAAHQEKDGKTGKRRAGVERRLGDFEEAACYPSADVQGAAWQKNGLCEGSYRDNWDSRKDQQPF